MGAKSLVCRDCGTQLRDHAEAQAHADLMKHVNFEESEEALLRLVCDDCGKPCRSTEEKETHTHHTGHQSFTDKTGETEDIVTKTQPSTSSASSKKVEILGPLLEQLTEDMGFPKIRAEKALMALTTDDLEAAVTWLTEHADDADIDAPHDVPPEVVAERKKLSKAERDAKIEALRLQAKEKREADEKARDIAREKDRVSSGKKASQMKRDREDVERRLLAEQRLKEKKADEAYLKKLREQIRADKASRGGGSGGTTAATPVESSPAAAQTPVASSSQPPSNQPISPAPPSTANIAEQLHNHLVALKRDHGTEGEQVVTTAYKTMFKYISNIAKQPDNEKFRRINLSNEAFHSRVGRFPCCVEFLKAAGFEATADALVMGPPNLEHLNLAGGSLNNALTNPYFGTL
eukprot:Rmarinus@m.261